MQQRELQIVVAKIMPPLGHTVGFIDSEQGDLGLFQQRQRARLYQPLRGDVEHVQLALQQGVFQLAYLLQ